MTQKNRCLIVWLTVADNRNELLVYRDALTNKKQSSFYVVFTSISHLTEKKIIFTLSVVCVSSQ